MHWGAPRGSTRSSASNGAHPTPLQIEGTSGGSLAVQLRLELRSWRRHDAQFRNGASVCWWESGESAGVESSGQTPRDSHAPTCTGVDARFAAMSAVWAARMRWPLYIRCLSDRLSFEGACNHKMRILILFWGFSDLGCLGVKQFLRRSSERSGRFI
jgi:hypothetical protein